MKFYQAMYLLAAAFAAPHMSADVALLLALLAFLAGAINTLIATFK